MKIQYCSDLHLEFKENKKFLKANPLKPVGDILVLAGDIIPFAVIEQHGDFFKYVADNFSCTYWLPGNHEYYYADAANKSGIVHETIRSNVFLINNVSLQYNNVRLIFSTLWSHISPVNEWQIEKGVSDFAVIKFNGCRLSVPGFNQLHEDSLRFVTEETAKSYEGKTVVVTHHVPTFLNYPAKYKGDILNEAFGTELFDLIEGSEIDYWIYGHHHFNTPGFTIGETQMLTNQLGYVQQGEHHNFDNAKTITV